MKLNFVAILILLSIDYSVAAKIENPLYSIPPERMAVLSFDSNNDTLANSNVSEYFTNQIFKLIKKVNLVERKDMAKILEENKLTLTGLVQSNNHGAIGTLKRADSLVIGNVSAFREKSSKGTINVIIKLVKSETGEIFWVDKRTFPCRFLDSDTLLINEEKLQSLAEKMVKKMNSYLYKEYFSSEKEYWETTIDYKESLVGSSSDVEDYGIVTYLNKNIQCQKCNKRRWSIFHNIREGHFFKCLECDAICRVLKEVSR